MLARRRFLQLGATSAASALALPLLAPATPAGAAPAAGRADGIATAADFAALEAASGGRLGVSLLDTATGQARGHRQDERFPMCSTFKALLSAAVLAGADRGQWSLDRRLPVGEGDLVPHSPVTRRHVGKDLTVRDLCRATMTTSDNAAANLLSGLIGGPAALTAFLRAHGDAVTRNDRLEPVMNGFAPDDPRDTTSPGAMAASMARFAVGDVLAPASRQQLADWLIDNGTGDACLRAGLGPRWRVGDKTGSNGVDTRNDVAVLWPLDGGRPWVLAAYLQGATVDSDARDAVLARAARLAEAMIGRGP
ncbi:class A beta-lactamase [Pseudoxanthomonas sp. J35]|uniref:class A beta-lactamase n=1 Tax=Pseudoxanthomonas sp. J35 TaxID=935852 RepID=UPI00048CB86D|nr:class A beta-lactamase [Pseudoxanthomonas sp. J35]